MLILLLDLLAEIGDVLRVLADILITWSHNDAV